MALGPGTTVGRYEVRDLLGAGGMGEVYKAHDPTLGRFVALKILRQDLSADRDRLARFLQEARAASALNHPNILTIYEVGTHQDSQFILSEFVEGETLRQRLDRGPLSLREMLDVVMQTASALAAAHAAGIVHRDIKPENLMLRPDGYVKVLDFGVAKLASAKAGSAETSMTVAGETGIGMVVGTMAYMAPEQARGLSVDGRADSFSLGVVLYELITGRTPFAGATTSDVLVAILDKEPPSLRSLARGVPPQLEWIVSKALDKDPQLRYQSIADFRVDLLRLKNAIDAGRLSDSSEAVVTPAAVADQPIEAALTDDSPQVAAVSRVSRVTMASAAAALIALVGSFLLYPSAHIGADLPLQVPEGAALTKARDALQSLGYTNWGSRTAINFEPALDVGDVAALDSLAAAREAVREGRVARWDVGFSTSRDANALLDDDPTLQEGDLEMRLDPQGRIVRFAAPASPAGATPLDRDAAVKQGIDTVRRVYGADVSAWELEFVQRAFPAGTVEMTWRNPARRFGHVEQIAVHLQGDRLTRLNRWLDKPPGFDEPPVNVLSRALEPIAPLVFGLGFFASWAFGLYVLVRSRSWDAITERLPIAICAMLVASILAEAFQSARWQDLVAISIVAVLLLGTVLPALSGLTLWIRRQSAARLWAAEQLCRGRGFNRAVAISIVDGSIAGVMIALVAVLADFAGLQIPGFLPSISAEINAVEYGVLRIVTDAIASSTFAALAVAVAVEALQRARLQTAVSLVLVFVLGVLLSRAQHLSILALAPPAIAAGTTAVLLAIAYRRRGLLACWIAVAISEMLAKAMATRSLDEPDRVWLSNAMLMLIAAIVAVGVWGLVAPMLRQQPPATAPT